MATATQNALLSRTRSARLNTTNSSKAIATAPTEGLAPSKQSTTLATPSNVSLFLTNLRLLDLDLLPDWPDINSLTFTNKDVAQGQKKRVQCVEWALFQLFSLWDPEMASNVRKNCIEPSRFVGDTNAPYNRNCSPSSPHPTKSSRRTYERPCCVASNEPRRVGSWGEMLSSGKACLTSAREKD